MSMVLGHIPRETVNQDAVGVVVLVVLLVLGLIAMTVIALAILVVRKLMKSFSQRAARQYVGESD